MKRRLCRLSETDQLIQLARTLTRPAPYSDRQFCTVRCPKCNGRLYAAMTRTGPRFLCDCKEAGGQQPAAQGHNTIPISTLDAPPSDLRSPKKGA
jgi:hypothetical protein